MLDETFWRPNDRRPDPPLEIRLGGNQLPADQWLPVTVAWNVADASAQISVAGSERQLAVEGEPLGLCYLTVLGRSERAESGGTLVRRLETQVED